ncbi:MAG: hypothetical protein PHI63_06820 [Patescibacteria group bacterium]|nr:hypothetical protein [Patescibacteria group bacterium]
MCYSVPVVATLVAALMRRRKPDSGDLRTLTIMLLGGSLFGIVDHGWNGELLLISKNWVPDLLLGATITLAIIAGWGIIVASARTRRPLAPPAMHS